MNTADPRVAVLALEHESVWLYGLLAARFADLADAAAASFTAHRRERDRLYAALGDDAVGPAPSYSPVGDDPTAARGRAQDVEHRLTATWLTIVGEVTGDRRAEAVERMTAAAVARTAWGAAPEALPGLDA